MKIHSIKITANVNKTHIQNICDVFTGVESSLNRRHMMMKILVQLYRSYGNGDETDSHPNNVNGNIWNAFGVGHGQRSRSKNT